jgi:hypothetical protein
VAAVVVWACVLATAACSSGSGVGPGGGADIDAAGVSAPDSGGPPVWLADAISGGGDAKPSPGDVGPDGEEPASWQDCATGAEPGCPCDDHAQCYSGWCVATGDGDRCTAFCDDGCPVGWTCAGVSSGGGADVAFLCVPLWVNLCRPCETGDDCAQLGETGGWCLAAADGAGSFCGGGCDEGGACPDGYSCEALDVGDGVTVEQCVPAEGAACECNLKAIREGAGTVCGRSNEVGACFGVRACTGVGLSTCDAPFAAAESCNAVDDDCDGVVDDVEPQPCERSNTHGACAGLATCAGGGWLPCSAAEPAPEICNGVDDDCDGEVDEGEADLDGDGTADCVDPDVDGDDVPDGEDLCPTVADPDQADLDGDGAGDACDEDIDGDGSPNGEDCLPEQAAFHPGAVEACDGVDQNCDGAPDDGFDDTDGDGAADCVDPDDDDDGVSDETDLCPLVADPDQADCDGDGAGDACDEDDDADGVPDVDDCATCDPGVFPGAVDGCNAADDDCDEVVDEDCSYVRVGSAFGAGFAASASFGYVARGSLGTVGFVGQSGGAEQPTIRSGLPPHGSQP